MRIRLVAVLMAALLLGFPGVASAVTTVLDISPGTSFPINNLSGLTGNITFMSVETGDPSGGSGSVGGATLPGSTDQSFVFEVQVLTGSLANLTVSASHCVPGPQGEPANLATDCAGSFPSDWERSPTGAGTLANGGINISDIIETSSSRIFEWGSGSLGAGQTGDPFFISFADGNLGFDGTYFFSFTTAPSGDEPQTTIQLVPEPSAWALLGLALASLGISARRRGHN